MEEMNGGDEWKSRRNFYEGDMEREREHSGILFKTKQVKDKPGTNGCGRPPRTNITRQ